MMEVFFFLSIMSFFSPKYTYKIIFSQYNVIIRINFFLN